LTPSILLQPLNFFGNEDDQDLGFFPGMSLAGKVKLELVSRILEMLTAT